MTISGQLDARTWINSDGKSIEADFIRYKDDTHIVIEMKGKEYTVPLSNFSQSDIDWLAQKKKGDANPDEKDPAKQKDLTGRFDNMPIHLRLFPEAKDYLRGSDRKRIVKAAGTGQHGGDVNSGTQEEWLLRDLINDTCSIYVPSSYDGTEAYGVFLYINHSPSAFIDKSWYPIFDEFKLIAVSANNADNGVAYVRRVCLSMDALATVEKDYLVDPDRRVVAGTSGGGHMAMLTAAMFPETFLGAISSAAQSYLPGHFPGLDVGDFKRGARKKNKWLVISGQKDKNYSEILKTSEDWNDARLQYKFIDVPDMGHSPPPVDRLPECLEWIGLKKP